jgi:hypothetical protein
MNVWGWLGIHLKRDSRVSRQGLRSTSSLTSKVPHSVTYNLWNTLPSLQDLYDTDRSPTIKTDIVFQNYRRPTASFVCDLA